MAAWKPVSTVDHAQVRGACSSCHNGTVATGKETNHIPTTQECSTCHSTMAWKPATFSHAGISTGCSNCHDGIHANGKNATHAFTTNVCEACHATSAWKPVTKVDHAQVLGSCSSCHDGTAATGKPPTHIATTAECSACHSTLAWKPATGFSHDGITDNCYSCHNGTKATGKNSTHIQTSNLCENCHTPTAWKPATRVDHTQVIGTCVACHDGKIATGKNATHIASDTACDACHTTTAWKPVIHVDHAHVIGVCSSCHDGIKAAGKPAGHLVTTQECGACHSTLAWKPAKVDHTKITGGCKTCHDGKSATGPNTGHMTFPVNNFDCNHCHTVTAWSPNTFKHVAGGGYPGDHRVALTCASCHKSNTDAATWPAPAYKPDCAGCHAIQVQAGPAHEVRQHEVHRQRVAQLLGRVPHVQRLDDDDHHQEPPWPGTPNHRLEVRLTMVSLRRLICCTALAMSASGVHAQSSVRLVEDVGASEQRDYVAVTLVFGCTLRYVSHTPASAGDTVQVRLSAGPDCGPASGDISQPLTTGASGFVRSIETVRPFGSDVELRIAWNRAEQFVIVPSFDGHGLRIRLLRPESPKVSVAAVPQGTSTYAVNLDSATEPYSQEALMAAAAATGVRAYVSEVVVDEQRWYRLRAGPFVTESDAKTVLAKARTNYPKSWVAIADDAEMTAVGTPTAIGHVEETRTPSSTTLTSPDIDKTLKQAKDSFRHKDYVSAIPLLTKLLEQPEFPQRAEAQELLALSHERSGQLAHAKADYEDYLRRYPQGPGADRVKKRLRALALATRTSSGVRLAGEDESPWRFYGGFSQIYRQDSTSLKTNTTSTDLTTQDALLNDVGLVARRRGERFDFSTRVAAGYTLDMLQNGPGDQSRITMLFAELNDRQLDWMVRAGRQSGSAGGLLGTFDGIYGGYQVRPRFRLNAYYGYPVESTRDGPNTDRKFYGLSADFGTFANAWDFSVYAISQEYFGVTDRQAVGTEVRYFKPGITFVGLVDYDIHYQDLNNVLLLGTFELPARWTLNANLDHRKSPGLTTRNAMIGQPVTSFDQLFGLFSPSEIEQLARDRTAESDTYTLSLSRPLGERWHWSTDVASMTIGSTPASGGVPATAATGTDLSVATQLLGFGLFGHGDVSTLGFQYQDGATQQTMSLGRQLAIPHRRALAVATAPQGGPAQVQYRQFDTADVHANPAHRAEGEALHPGAGRRGRDRLARSRADHAGHDEVLFQPRLPIRLLGGPACRPIDDASRPETTTARRPGDRHAVRHVAARRLRHHGPDCSPAVPRRAHGGHGHGRRRRAGFRALADRVRGQCTRLLLDRARGREPRRHARPLPVLLHLVDDRPAGGGRGQAGDVRTGRRRTADSAQAGRHAAANARLRRDPRPDSGEQRTAARVRHGPRGAAVPGAGAGPESGRHPRRPERALRSVDGPAQRDRGIPARRRRRSLTG